MLKSLFHPIFVLTLLMLQTGVALAQYDGYGEKKYGEYVEEEQWVEQETEPPAFPNMEHLIEFDAGAATGNHYFVDADTLTVGKDRVVRFVTVVKTRGGAVNISYEGLNCPEKAYKRYAFGHSDGRWQKNSKPEWRDLRQGGYQAHLGKNYFCPRHIAIFTAEEGIRALRQGGHPDLQ